MTPSINVDPRGDGPHSPLPFKRKATHWERIVGMTLVCIVISVVAIVVLAVLAGIFYIDRMRFCF